MRWLLLGSLLPLVASGYPLDGYPETGIRRLEAAQLAQDGKLEGRRLPTGALLNLQQVHPSEERLLPLPAKDIDFSTQIRRIIEDVVGPQASTYAIAVLDFSQSQTPAYGDYRGDTVSNVGSVGKIIVMLALLQALAERYPDDVEARARILRDTRVVADDYIIRDNHKVPIYSLTNGSLVRRRLQIGDSGNLWEFLDWMLSASSNGAASMVIQQLVLMRHLGHDYPLDASQHRNVLERLSAGERGRLMRQSLDSPLLSAGFDTRRLRQASPLTYTAKKHLPGERSHANPRDLVRLMALIESGKFIDAWSSREAKRLLYLTDRRTRYASSTVLNSTAVYFKSGSMYSCHPEPGVRCLKYRGTRVNRLASLILVEDPARNPRLRYIVALMSNVLKRNSAFDHQDIGERIHALIRQRQTKAAQSESATPHAVMR